MYRMFIEITTKIVQDVNEKQVKTLYKYMTKIVFSFIWSLD